MALPIIFLVEEGDWAEFDQIIAQPQRQEIRLGDEIFFLVRGFSPTEIESKLENLVLDWAKWESTYEQGDVIKMKRIG